MRPLWTVMFKIAVFSSPPCAFQLLSSVLFFAMTSNIIYNLLLYQVYCLSVSSHRNVTSTKARI